VSWTETSSWLSVRWMPSGGFGAHADVLERLLGDPEAAAGTVLTAREHGIRPRRTTTLPAPPTSNSGLLPSRQLSLASAWPVVALWSGGLASAPGH